MSNYRIDFLTDQHDNTVDVRYWHAYCADTAPASEDAPTLGWPCPEWPDYDVHCSGCLEIIHHGGD